MKTRPWQFALVVGTLVVGCTTEPEDPGDPPVLPLEETMIFDTETFPSAGGLAAGAQAVGAEAVGAESTGSIARQVGGGSHHAAAVIGVIGINIAVLVVTSVPRLTWAALATRQPTFEDGRWHWRGSTDILGVTYSGDLTGYIEQGEVVAEVRISSPAVADFLWYDGRAPIGGNTGQWRVYDHNQPTTQTVLSTIDWSHPASDVWNLTFTAVGGPNPGDNLSYMVDGDSRSVSWSDASEDASYEIVWDVVTREGHITAAGYNGGMMSCWDQGLQNVTCP